MHAIYVEVQTSTNIVGLLGPIEVAQAIRDRRDAAPFRLGRDPLAIELLLDQMLRLERHGRSGLFVTAISAIDCALWELKDKAWGQPMAPKE